MSERIEVQRLIRARPSTIFGVLCDPQGHVAIDSSGMLQSATGVKVRAAGDSFVVHMDREALNDYPELGQYDVTVLIRSFEQDREISWYAKGTFDLGHYYGYRLEPGGDSGTVVTSYYDWSEISQDWRDSNIFPVMSEGAIRATLGILARTVQPR